MLHKVLRGAAIAVTTVLGASLLLAGAMWVSPAARYRIAYFLVEHTDINGTVTSAQLAHHTHALKHATLIGRNNEAFDWDRQPRAIIWINEWSYFCIPCRFEFPAMRALQKRVGSDKLRIVLYSEPQFWDKDKREAETLGLPFEMITTKGASAADTAAIVFGHVRHGRAVGEIMPTNSFMRANGEGLAAYRAPRDWDSSAWAAIVRHWYDEGLRG